MKNNNRFYGILKSFDFNTINRESFPVLLNSGIFDELELSNCFKSNGDYFGIELNNDTWSFGDFFLFKGKEYYLKKEIYTEMVFRKNWTLKSFSNVNFITNQIEVLIENELIPKNKIQIIDDNFKLYFNQIKNKEYYSLFKNQTETNDYKCWEEYFIDEIVEKQNFEFLVNFLQGNNDYIPSEIKQQWEDYFLVSEISDYCNLKITAILSKQKSGINKKSNIKDLSEPINNTNLSDIIFKPNGEKMFNFLISKYPLKKNTAFFSYLYFYLMDDLKLLYVTGNDSLDYRNHVIKRFNISFKRIQTTNSNNKFKRDKILRLFNEYTLEFTQYELSKS